MREVLSVISLWSIPVLLVGIPLYGIVKKVKVYEVFVDGAKEGFEVAIRIIPFLVAILVAIGMFRGSGAMEMLTDGLRPVLSLIVDDHRKVFRARFPLTVPLCGTGPAQPVPTEILALPRLPAHPGPALPPPWRSRTGPRR
ncbi:MAG: hypothetical protein ABR524_03080 [Thermoanaerobaculia bacterium]